MKSTLRNVMAAGGVLLFFSSSAPTVLAGSFIIAGTDADDHGFVSGGANQDGWLFMQKSLENIAPGVTNANKTVVVLGSNPGSIAGNAALSAFNLSSLPANGWTVSIVNTVASLTSFFSTGIDSAGILMMDSGANVSGGADSNERGLFTTNASVINNFLGNGGGLFSQANGYGWVSALLPGLTVVNQSDTGLTLTAVGTAAFPGLNNGDLSTGPWHNSFATVGSLPVLATGNSGTQFAPVILGAQGGSVTNPDPPTASVPDTGSTLILMLGSIGSLFAGRRLLKKGSTAA